MSEADDVLRSIDQLRRDMSGYHGQLKAHNDLQRHCDNQRQRIAELEGLYAKAKSEIAELREQTRWMAQTDTRWEAAVRDCEETKAENAKLQELVALQREFSKTMCGHKCKRKDEYCGLGIDEECHYEHEIYDRMTELGIEVGE